MVLRCSLLGHDYGEPQVDRDREERGSEVVVTVQEYEECSRCDDRHVISENTEVTRLSTADAAETDAGDDGAADATAPTETPTGASTETEHPTATPDASHAVDDDGEILEESTDDRPAREHGEWPDSSDVGPPVGAEAEPAAWPDEDDSEADPSDEELSFSDPADAIAADAAEPEEDDGVILEDSSGSSGTPAASGINVTDEAASDDATPDDIVEAPGVQPTAGGDGAPGAGAADDASVTGIESAGAAPAPGEGGPADGADTEFFCPRCEFRASGERGSLRTGDICPDCRKGYLSERER